ncbi:MAG: hypothetical protein EOP47_02405 [Sphingobacteriaceae bacterium]|nr:MAG: hypothetical protein EOP47_02405 [Sphingobacteriaceae bacterium]
MKKLVLIIAVFITNICFAQQKVDFKPLHQLTGGSWQMKTAKGISGEKWKKISATELHSLGYKVSGKDTTVLEKVQLTQKSGSIYYIVNGQNNGDVVSFKLTEQVNNKFTFSNPKHDFPQKIIYHFVNKDSIHAWIDGQYNGKFVKQDFYYKRVK